MRVGNGLISVGDRETDGNGNPSEEMVCQKLYAAQPTIFPLTLQKYPQTRLLLILVEEVV